MKTPDSELRRLTDAWHDGSITPEQGRRLESRLLEDAEARKYFFEITEIEMAMGGALSGMRQPAMSPRQTRRPAWWRMAAVFLIGGFCGALLIKTVPSGSQHRSSQSSAAVVTGMLGVSWGNQAHETALAFSANSHESKIGSGLLELTFASGTRTVIEGPAEFRVLGDNSMCLNRGKLVADVPKGAEGFSVTYPDGKIVDLGTEFGLEVGEGGYSADFGVFRGEIEYHRRNRNAPPVRLPENHAVRAINGTVVSVPFEQEKFTRKLPSREFSWKFQGESQGPAVWDYDISHLVWNAGSYRVICKWMMGRHGIAIHGAQLLLDGRLVASDGHEGGAGDIDLGQRNTFDLLVPSDAYRRGVWTLRIHAAAIAEAGEELDSSGVVLVESGLALEAKPEDFTGTWTYLHDGKIFHRSFLPDGSAKLVIDGTPYPAFEDARWRVENGCLILDVGEGGKRWKEHHFLRDARTLVFANRPYRNAIREED